jgi:hypothetical protein
MGKLLGPISGTEKKEKGHCSYSWTLFPFVFATHTQRKDR